MLACVADAKKGKDEGKIGSARNAWGEGERKRLQPAHSIQSGQTANDSSC